MDYMEFLKSKFVFAKETGFEANDSDLSPALKPHQKEIIHSARETLNIGLFNRIRLIRQGRKWNNDIPPEKDIYKTAAKVCAYIAFGLTGVMLWYKFLLEGVR